jgi:hypothetical protein
MELQEKEPIPQLELALELALVQASQLVKEPPPLVPAPTA